jgi:hypothetical protein
MPDMPHIEDREEILLSAPAARYRMRNRTKYNLFTAGRLTLTNKRLIYAATGGPKDLGDVETAWQGVAHAVAIHGLSKIWLAPRPYVFYPMLRHPMFRVDLQDRSGALFRLFSSDGWLPAVNQLRILYPQLDPLAA